MEPFTIALFTIILICILAGIGAGFHLAFTTARERPPKARKNKAVDEQTEEKKEKKPWISRPWVSKDKHLSSKIHDQSGQSFAEFDCQFTGEDPDEKLQRARSSQDDSYNCLQKESQT